MNSLAVLKEFHCPILSNEHFWSDSSKILPIVIKTPNFDPLKVRKFKFEDFESIFGTILETSYLLIFTANFF